MKKCLFGRRAFLISLSLAFVPALLMEGCAGVSSSTGVTNTSLISSDRRKADVIVLDRSTQLNAKSVANRTLHYRGHIEVTVYNQIVLLTGQVPSRDDKSRVERAVLRIRNVSKLVSELTVTPETTIMQRAKDAAITARVKVTIAQLKGPLSSVVRVVTENGVVYLMGIVTREEAAVVSSCVRVITGVEKVVEVFQIIPQEKANLLDQYKS